MRLVKLVVVLITCIPLCWQWEPCMWAMHLANVGPLLWQAGRDPAASAAAWLLRGSGKVPSEGQELQEHEVSSLQMSDQQSMIQGNQMCRKATCVVENGMPVRASSCHLCAEACTSATMIADLWSIMSKTICKNLSAHRELPGAPRSLWAFLASLGWALCPDSWSCSYIVEFQPSFSWRTHLGWCCYREKLENAKCKAASAFGPPGQYSNLWFITFVSTEWWFPLFYKY